MAVGKLVVVYCMKEDDAIFNFSMGDMGKMGRKGMTLDFIIQDRKSGG